MYSGWFEVFAGLSGITEYRYDPRTGRAQRRLVAEPPDDTQRSAPRDCSETPPISEEERALMRFVENELFGG